MILYGLGDEHTLGWKYTPSSNICEQYKTWIADKFTDLCYEDSYLPLSKTVWIEKLSRKLKCDFKLLAKQGSTNLDIFNSFISNIDLYKEGDMLIINWTNNYKFNIYSNDEINSISNVYDYISVEDLIEPTTISDIFKNRGLLTAVYEVHSYEKAIIEICNKKNIQVFFWSIDNLNHLTHNDDTLLKPEYILGRYLVKYRKENGIEPFGDYYSELDKPLFYSSINYIDGQMFMMTTDTNGEIASNTFLGERGHDVLSHHFFSHFVKHTKNKSVTKNLLL